MSVVTVDFLLFTYEICTGTQARLLLLVTEDSSVTFGGSLGAAVFEMLFRLWTVRKVVREREKLTRQLNEATSPADIQRLQSQLEDANRYARIIVRNIQGDMVAEYVTQVTAVLVQFYFAPMGEVFTLGPPIVDLAKLFEVLVLAQLLPELLSDIVGSSYEVYHGLPVMEYWYTQTMPLVLAKLIAVIANFCIILASVQVR